MKPHELCEPLFQYMCRLNRSARKGGFIDPDQTRNDLRLLLADIKTKAIAAGPQLADQFDRNKGKLELALMFFIDHMIRTSNLTFAQDWNSLAEEESFANGDERFFELLDETLSSHNDEAANDRVAVYYTCMGLGFTGVHTGRLQYLRQKMEECWSRLRGVWDVNNSNRICPEAYESVNTSNLVQPPARGLVGIGIGLVGAVLVLFAANGFLYKSSSQELERSVKAVVSHTPQAPSAPAPAAGKK